MCMQTIKYNINVLPIIRGKKGFWMYIIDEQKQLGVRVDYVRFLMKSCGKYDHYNQYIIYNEEDRLVEILCNDDIHHRKQQLQSNTTYSTPLMKL